MQQTERIDSLTSGSELHGYVVDCVLGSGAFGITYLVRHRHLDTLHVIKEYLPDCAMREHSRSTVSPKSSSDKDLFDWGLKSFYKEAQLLHQLSHPHIVKVTDLFEANGTAYFVMPYLRGYTLHEWMKNHPSPSQEELETIFVPLLEGLKYIHEKGLLHRDVKPENIYITDNTNPILIDFGSARMAIGQKSRALTQILTPHFAPIEQYASKGTFTPAMDLYGFAGCMYQAITGEMPEEAPNRLVEDEQPRLAGSEYEKRYAGHFLQAIDKSLSVHARDRHQDGFALQKDLVGRDEAPETPTQDEFDSPSQEAGKANLEQMPAQPQLTPPDRDSKSPLVARPDGSLPIMASSDLRDDTAESLNEKTENQSVITGRKQRTPSASRKWLLTVLLILGAVGGIWFTMDHRKDQSDAAVSLVDPLSSLVPVDPSLNSDSLLQPLGIPPEPGEIRTDPYTGMEFVWVPIGCFQMGCGLFDSECYDDEKPLHQVCLNGFWMGKYPVTQAQWEKVMGSQRRPDFVSKPVV